MLPFPPLNNAFSVLFHNVAGALLREGSSLLLLGSVRLNPLQPALQHSLTPALHPHFSSIPLLLPAGRFAGEILLAVCMQGGPGALRCSADDG